MSVVSEEYIMQLLNKYIMTGAGNKKIAKIWPELSRRSAHKIARDICEKFKNVIREVIDSFRLDAIHVKMKGIDSSGRLRASIMIDEDAMRRESLHQINKDLSIRRGEGVQDILALFTHGYTLRKRPYGFWVRSGGNSIARIGARVHRDSNPFLINFVNQLNTEYAGRCVVTLDDKYTTQGGG